MTSEERIKELEKEIENLKKIAELETEIRKLRGIYQYPYQYYPNNTFPNPPYTITC
jgi:hypothetical protein